MINNIIRLATFFAGMAFMATGCKSEKEKLAEKIKTNEEKLFNDSTKMLDISVANEEMIAYRDYVSKFPDDTASPGYLFKAADLAHGLKRNREAVGLYQEFQTRYGTHPKVAASLFLRAFVYDADLRQKDSAKILYREFLEKYPSHQLAPSAKSSLDQIEMGLTDEQLIKIFEARLDSSEKAEAKK